MAVADVEAVRPLAFAPPLVIEREGVHGHAGAGRAASAGRQPDDAAVVQVQPSVQAH